MDSLVEFVAGHEPSSQGMEASGGAVPDHLAMRAETDADAVDSDHIIPDSRWIRLH
jgi:hypothetical protein